MDWKINHALKLAAVKLFAIGCILSSQAYAAENPCGVNCTQTIANSIVSNAINTRLYEKNVIYAENTANITNGGGAQWAFGDGNTGAIGIPLPESWELYAVSLQARSVSANANVVINIRNINDGSTIYQVNATLSTPVPPASNGVYTEVLTTPVTIAAGSTIGFSTVSVSAGTVSGARIGAWLRRRAD